MFGFDAGRYRRPELQIQSRFERARLVALLWVFGLAASSAALTWQHPESPLAAGLWAASVMLLPLAWLQAPSHANWRELALLGGLFVVALIPRVLWVDRLPLGLNGDEAAHMLVAQRILQTGLVNALADHGWGIPVWGFLWQVAFVGFLGPAIDTVRVASSVAGALTVVLTYLWAKELAGRNVGLIAAGLMLLAHTHLMMSHLGTVNSQAPLLTTLTIWLMTISWQRRSVMAAALSASAFMITVLNWSGDRIIVPIVLAGVLYALLVRRTDGLLVPVSVFAVGVLLLAATPAAYYSRAPDGLNLVLARSDKSLLHPAGWNHTFNSTADKSLEGVLKRQIGGTLGAFVAGGSTDTSTFYNFNRPILDAITLAAAVLGLLVVLTSARRSTWVFPPLVVALTLAGTSLIVDPPNYTRLGLAMTSIVVLAALGIDTARRLLTHMRLPALAATLVTVSVVAGVAAVNATWFFRDYPREGVGAFTMLSVGGEILSRVVDWPVRITRRISGLRAR